MVFWYAVSKVPVMQFRAWARAQVRANPFFIEGASRFTSETGCTNNRPARNPRHRLGGSSDALWEVKRYGINFTDLDKLVIILNHQLPLSLH